MLELLESSPLTLALTVALLGLCVGSFINVVAYRLPKMIEQSFRREAREFLRLPPRPEREPVSLSSPGSTCPSCRTPIKPWHNVTLFGWLLLRGRCASCLEPF